mgnify:FL=1
MPTRPWMAMVCVTLLHGCGTLQTTCQPQRLPALDTSRRSYCNSIPSIYAGASYDLCASAFSRPGEVDANAVSAAHLLSLPLVAIGDTLLLPYTVLRQLQQGNLPLKRDP